MNCITDSYGLLLARNSVFEFVFLYSFLNKKFIGCYFVIGIKKPRNLQFFLSLFVGTLFEKILIL